MFYRENGQFKTSYRSDQQIFAIAQDRWAILALIAFAFVGVHQVAGGDRCTLSEPAEFYSFRRDRITGRMATMIWIR